MSELLKIDEEFQSKIPPLTADEFRQLEQNIVEDGEVHTPIVVWNGTIVDGHNRWKIIQKHPDIPYKIKEMDFKDKWEAFDWMYKNQLGRRNLTDEQRKYLLGKLYEARKHTVGGDRRSEEFSSRNDCDMKKNTFQNGRTKRIADIIGEEQGVGGRSVTNAYNFAQGIDAIKKEDPEVAEQILQGKKRVITDKEVEEIRKAEPQEVKSTIKAIKEGTVKQRARPKPKTPEEKKELDDIARRVNETRTRSTYTPDVNDLIKDLKNNSAPYIRLLNQMINGYKSVIKGNGDIVLQTIKECIEDEIEKMKERITNEYA